MRTNVNKFQDDILVKRLKAIYKRHIAIDKRIKFYPDK